MPGWSDNFNVPIYANVSWQTANEKGFTTTSPFIIATSNLTMGEANTTLLERGPSVDTAAEVTTSQNSPTASNPSTPGGSGSSEPASAGTAGSSLPTGAIAGIAIGGAAALAIVGVLVWFFCFRRRKQHGQVRSAEYGHDAGTHAMMVDKEAPGVSTSSPHRAYGDDGGRLHDRSSAAMDSSYAPYSDHGPASHASPAVAQPMPVHATPVVQPSLPRGTDSPTPSQPATTQYAHLVEEGMTADEIQRLEEEERALDQAIEAAGTNRPGR
ncbi:hypothetical protein Micbo1qcDRAFT_15117 [Microdochium bolleyi]|uniref:Mid2 domain-containing protein n=1 Tax=Microdochium bolleyi TaxID=196109 RepID=A0A136IWX4_9PEZI|nr:hypothetical protein Micbo1qcDRAFT_15117 [Microdochium bolleyi]